MCLVPQEGGVLLETIGRRLRSRRQHIGLTQAALAQHAGVSVRFLVQLEKGRGNISVNRLADVCATLQLTLEDLFRGLGPRRSQTVALVGLRGAGKSTIGRKLAEGWGVEFIELDDEVVRAAGLSLSEIFEVGGQQLYRQLESRVITKVVERPGTMVLAAGGSVVTSQAAWKLLREKTRTVWLSASPRSHLERVIAQGDMRPMEGRPDALRELTEILATRAPLYAMAELTVDTDTLGIGGVIAQLEDWIQPAQSTNISPARPNAS